MADSSGRYNKNDITFVHFYSPLYYCLTYYVFKLLTSNTNRNGHLGTSYINGTFTQTNWDISCHTSLHHLHSLCLGCPFSFIHCSFIPSSALCLSFLCSSISLDLGISVCFATNIRFAVFGLEQNKMCFL